ncbi:MAG: GNAT family N-acetyltransferase [Dehalococcoidia bacterium]|jgi:GNAT superfamily N-acetyltransferase|nr:GNAT family N-acetyltransferase [Dehalococcoidia bacterium]
MSVSIEAEGPLLGQSVVCAPILEGLPEWFGIAEANAQYVRDIEVLPTFIARDGGEVVGFLTVKRHYPESAEVLVMGVRADRHRGGAGRALVEASEVWLRREGVTFLQVKTRGPSTPDPQYERTRAFYRAVGFVPLEEMLTLWSEDDAALVLVKTLG